MSPCSLTCDITSKSICPYDIIDYMIELDNSISITYRGREILSSACSRNAPPRPRLMYYYLDRLLSITRSMMVSIPLRRQR